MNAKIKGVPAADLDDVRRLLRLLDCPVVADAVRDVVAGRQPIKARDVIADPPVIDTVDESAKL